MTTNDDELSRLGREELRDILVYAFEHLASYHDHMNVNDLQLNVVQGSLGDGRAVMAMFAVGEGVQRFHNMMRWLRKQKYISNDPRFGDQLPDNDRA